MDSESYERLCIAIEFNIPTNQIATINLRKAKLYKTFMREPLQELERWMDEYILHRMEHSEPEMAERSFLFSQI